MIYDNVLRKILEYVSIKNIFETNHRGLIDKAIRLLNITRDDMYGFLYYVRLSPVNRSIIGAMCIILEYVKNDSCENFKFCARYLFDTICSFGYTDLLEKAVASFGEEYLTYENLHSAAYQTDVKFVDKVVSHMTNCYHIFSNDNFYNVIISEKKFDIAKYLVDNDIVMIKDHIGLCKKVAYENGQHDLIKSIKRKDQIRVNESYLLCEHIKCGDKRKIVKSLRRGADLNSQRGYPLLLAVKTSRYDIVELLLDSDDKVKNEYCKRAFFKALRMKYVDIAELISDYVWMHYKMEANIKEKIYRKRSIMRNYSLSFTRYSINSDSGEWCIHCDCSREYCGCCLDVDFMFDNEPDSDYYQPI